MTRFDYTKTAQRGIWGSVLSPHPDGKAWPKCCKDLPCEANSEGKVSCAFVHNQEYGARLDINKGDDTRMYSAGTPLARVNETPFMCVHRKTDDGYHRVCAGWDACFGNKHHGEV